MTDEAPFFVTRNGAVWACWLDGRPAMKLGEWADVVPAMAQFVSQSGPGSLTENPAPAAPEARSIPPTPLDPPPPVASLARQSEPPPRQQDVNERIEPRHDTAILGRVRTASGPRDVTVLDLSERGCRFLNKFGPLADGTPVTIKLGPIGPIDSTVRWSRGNEVGLEFNTPLYPSVLEHIRQHFDVRE